MHRGGEFRGGMKEFDGARKIEVGIRRAQGRDANGAGVGGDENRGGAGGLERGAIFEICEECKVAWRGIFNPCDVSDFGVGVAFELAAEFFGDLSQFHRGFSLAPHCILVFAEGITEKATGLRYGREPTGAVDRGARGRYWLAFVWPVSQIICAL